MPAANTDLLLKVASNTGWQLGASGITDAVVTSFDLVSAVNLPTDTAVLLTVDRVDASGVKTPSKMERIIGVVSGSSIISCVRGVEGTAQSHAGGAVVEIVIAKTNINKLMEHLLLEHNQNGAHKISALDGLRYAADAGGDDTYAITLTPAPSAYYAGMEVNFLPTTANTGACTLNVNGLGAKTIKKNVSSDLVTGDILAGQMVKVIYDGTNFQISSRIPVILNAPQGFLINGKIVPTVASNALTLAIKTLAGNDPSDSDPVYCRIGDTIRPITAALSVTSASGTAVMNLDASYMATYEVDLFAYLGYNATDGVVLGFARIPYAQQYSDFATSAVAEKYAKISTIANAASTDPYEVIGRFAATLNGSSQWSVPTYTPTNLIQRPIYRSRVLSYLPNGPTGATWTGKYIIDGEFIRDLDMAFTATGAMNWTNMPTIPFAVASGYLSTDNDHRPAGIGGYQDAGTANKTFGIVPHLGNDTPTKSRWVSQANSVSVGAANPITWAINDSGWGRIASYPIR